MKAERGYVTCPKLPSWRMTEMGFQPGKLDFLFFISDLP